MPQPIYVDIPIRASFDDLWQYTQRPHLHERWDLRFTSITYLPRESGDAPQRFQYETRIGFGLRIAGTGESVGSHETDNESTSALQFGSDDPKSLIRTGSGYWKYIQTDDHIRFLTQYDYQTRFGAPGRWLDRFLFRPILGWATAWSFDRLRLWLENGVDPKLSLVRAVCNTLCRTSLGVIWIYQGLIPKLIVRHSQELAMIEAAGYTRPFAHNAVVAIGALEVVFGLVFVTGLLRQAVHIINMFVLILFLCAAVIVSPTLAIAPFNPVSLTIAMLALSCVGLVCARDLPSARRCRRKPPEAQR